MRFRKKYLIQPLFVFSFLALTGFYGTQPRIPSKGYWAMKGNLVTHYFHDYTDSLSGPEIYELRDEKGLSLWFARHLFKDVCMTGECKMIRLWLFWDGAGNYLGMQVPDEEPLTRSDHVAFEPADYLKLEEILKDTASVLKTLTPEELIVVPDTMNPYKAYEVDGYTAATQPALADVVVKDAVYTCHTLWHTVYGPVQKTIQKIQDARLNQEYLSLCFDSSNPKYHVWAINKVKTFPGYHAAFYPQIVQCLRSENPSVASRALDYFQPAHLQNRTLQKKLAAVIPEVSTEAKYAILWKLAGTQEVDKEVILMLLQYFNQEKLGVGALNLIYRMIAASHLKQDEILQLVASLSESENNYVRNLTLKLLKDIPGTEQ